MFEHLVASRLRPPRRAVGVPLLAFAAHATMAVALVHATGHPALAPRSGPDTTRILPPMFEVHPRTPAREPGHGAPPVSEHTPDRTPPVVPTTEPLPIPSLDDVLAPARDAMHDAVLDRIRTAPRGGPVAAVGDGGPLGPATDPMATTPEGTPPRLLTMPEPSYPAALRAAGTEGAVELEYVVDVTGRVDTNSVRVLGPAPAPAASFVTAARVALAAARFAPARMAGQPSAARVRQRLVFRLTQAP